MELRDVISESQRLGMWAHLATVSPTGTPYLSPVHPCWEGETLWTMLGAESAKAKNLAGNPKASYHWQVSEATGFDSLILWGTGEVFADLDTKKRLWEGVFDYDLGDFAPGGPENSPDTAFMAFTPTKAVVLRQFGAAGREEWRA